MRRYVESLIWDDRIGASVDGFEHRRWLPAIPDAPCEDADVERACKVSRVVRGESDGRIGGGGGYETIGRRTNAAAGIAQPSRPGAALGSRADLPFVWRGIPRALLLHRAKLRARIAMEKAWLEEVENDPALAAEANAPARNIDIKHSRILRRSISGWDGQRAPLEAPLLAQCRASPPQTRQIAMPRPRPVERFLFGLDESGGSLWCAP